MGNLVVDVRGLFYRGQPVYLMVSGIRVGDGVRRFPEKMCVITKIQGDGKENDLVGHFLNESDEFFFPESCCRLPSAAEMSAVVDRPSLLIRP
jgi:hypothetical protein